MLGPHHHPIVIYWAENEGRRLLQAACWKEGLTWNINLYWPRTTGPTRTLSSSWSYFSDSAEPTYVNFHSKSAGRHRSCASAPRADFQAKRQSGFVLVTTLQRIRLTSAGVRIRHGSGCQMTSRKACWMRSGVVQALQQAGQHLQATLKDKALLVASISPSPCWRSWRHSYCISN